MSNAENINLSLSAGENSRKSNFKKINLKTVYDAIDEKVISESLRKKLKDKAKNYPHQALKIFLLSLDKHIATENRKNIDINNDKNELEFPE
jgi:hypothetical protein